MTGEIPEASASGAVARCYADIRARLGLPIVNLIWRRLAALGALEACWERVRDELPALTEQAAILNGRARQLIEPIPPCFSAGLQISTDARSIITSYERGNSINLATVSRLLGAPARRQGPGRLPQAPDRVRPVPELARLEPTARTAVDQLAQAGPAAATGIIPTLWIHLAEPPGLIEALARDLPAVLRSASFREAHGELTLLAAQPNPAERLAEPVRKCLQAFHQRIAEMVLIGVYLDTALSPHAEARP